MATEGGTPPPVLPTSLPQKRVIEDDHAPAVSSPLNPDVKAPSRVQIQMPDETLTAGREKRAKKESLKKRESNVGVGKGPAGSGDSGRATPDPKPTPNSRKGKGAVEKIDPEQLPMRWSIAPPKAHDFDPPRGPVFVSHHEVVSGADGRPIEFFETTEHVYNKKSFHYSHCIADPAFPSSWYYRQTEPEPYGPHMSFENAATHVFFDKTARHITTDKGFRGARANVAVREGRWYWECKITRGILKNKGEGDPDSHGHVRVGWSRREASIDAPVGFDAYSYGIRDVAGQKVHMSRPKEFFPPGEDLREGDVIGLEIQLPSENLHRKVVQGRYNPAVDLLDEDNGTLIVDPDEAPNIVRDRHPIRFKSHIYFEAIDYHSSKELEELMNPSPMSGGGPGGSTTDPPNPTHRFPNLRTLPNSHIKVYKNGKLMGTPWTELLAFLPPASKPAAQPDAREGLDDGMLGYYPTVSVFRGGAAEVNFGPDFWFPPEGYSNPQNEDVDMLDDHAETLQQHQKRSSATRPVSERYNEQIVEDIVYDIIDEVSFWIVSAGDNGKVEEAKGGARQQAEIKELVQDD